MVVQDLVEVRHGYAGCHHTVEVMGESRFICAAEDVGLELKAAGQTARLRLQDRQTAHLRLEQRWVERVVELHQHAGWRLVGRWTWGPERFFRLSACKIARMWTMVKAMRVEVKIWSEKGLGGGTG